MHGTSEFYKIGETIRLISQVAKVEGIFSNRIATTKTRIGCALRMRIVIKKGAQQ
jgi:hypothetical protein